MTNIVNTYFSDQDYQTIVQSVPICTVDLVIFNPEMTQTLLFKRQNKPLKNVYFTAGGRLFKNETLENCATRQAKRELGLSIETADLRAAGFVNEIFEDSAFGEVNYHTVNCFFSYILKSNDILKLDSQHSESVWFDILDLELHPLVKYRIEACLKVLGR
jgi:colanic acid biosynthesis protein WcaH